MDSVSTMSQRMNDRIRKAIPEDVFLLGAIEREAAALFPAGRIPDVDEVTSVEDFEEGRGDGLLFVADAGAGPVGFAICSEEPDSLHLEELAVHPEHGRRGLGRRLVLAVIEEAAARGLNGVSLTTFADLPFNGPVYTGMGFRTLAEAELDERLAATLAAERSRGLTRRIAMFRPSAPDRKS